MNTHVEYNSERPHIQSVIMCLILDHFRSHILKSSTKRVPLLAGIRLHTPTKIAYFDDISFLNENVFWFDVPVDETLFMHVVDA